MILPEVAVSTNNKLMSYSSDTMGRRVYKLNFKNLETGEILQDQIPNTTGKAVWANDNGHIYYIRKDDSLRAFQVYMHQLGTDSSQDVLVFHEEDDTFDVNVFKTKSLEYIFRRRFHARKLYFRKSLGYRKRWKKSSNFDGLS